MSDFTSLLPDFSQAVEFDDSQVPPGVYKVRVDSFVNKTGKESGAAYIQWKLIIFGAEGDFARQNNRVLFTNTMLAGKGAGKLKQLLIAAFGELPTDFSGNWPDQVIGKELQVTCKKNIKPDGTEGWPDVTNVTAIKH